MFAIPIASLHPENTLVDLPVNICPWEAATGTEAAVVAKGTATRCDAAIDVWTSESSINAHFLHPKSKPTSQEEVIRKVPESRLAPGGSRWNRRKWFG